MQDQLKSFERFGVWLGIFLLIFIFIYSISTSGLGFAHRFALFVVVSASSGMVGGFLGFIFGIPRVLRQDGSPATPVVVGQLAPPAGTAHIADRSSRAFAGNTNLEEISDWLTKIIIGVGLVQAQSIYRGLIEVSVRFEQQAMPGVQGAGALFLALVLVSGTGGFLFFYLQTRTRITLLLSDADHAAVMVGHELEVVVDQALSAPIRDGDDKLDIQEGNVTTKHTKADKTLIKIKFEDLTTPDLFAAWAAAQARFGNFQAALKAIQEAISREPGKVSYLEMLGDIRLLQGNAQAAVDAYVEARSKAIDKSSIFRKEILACLYIPPPEGFRRAIVLIDEIAGGHRELAVDPMVQLWAAAAYGQKYLWLKMNGGQDKDLIPTEDAAFAYIGKVIDLVPDPTKKPRELLLSLFDPARGGAISGNDDLQVFFEKERFRKLILGPQD